MTSGPFSVRQALKRLARCIVNRSKAVFCQVKMLVFIIRKCWFLSSVFAGCNHQFMPAIIMINAGSISRE
jgi:hypothetical protein